MSLGPQCWRCRKKRLRCDSSQPACRKCGAADVECPGYGEKRPIAWRNPLVLTDKGIVRIREHGAGERPASASVMGIVCRAPRTVSSELELRITADAIEYCVFARRPSRTGELTSSDNLHVAPDLVPYATQRSPYQISPSEVGELAEYVRKSYISISALHRFVSGETTETAHLACDGSGSSRAMTRSCANVTPLSGASDLSVLIASGDFESVHFASQAAAIRALSDELNKHRAGVIIADAGPGLLLGIMLMLSSQIQYSAYASWQTHIRGAWGLIAAQGGVEILAKQNRELCRVLQQVAIVDIFGMSTHRLTPLTARTVISRHASYAMIFDANAADILNPWTLMPNDLAKILNQINTMRARDTLEPSTKTRMEGLSTVLSFLEKATPDSWASEVATNANVWLSPGHLSEGAETKAAWKAMMMAFLSAAVLYAINSLAGMRGTPTRLAAFSREPMQYLVGRETTAYDALMSSIRLLFSQRVRRQCQQDQRPFKSPATSAGLLHKFVIWPMVVGGIQAALVHHDDEGADFLCSGMQSVGEELGTVSIIDGARLVERLRRSQRDRLEPRSWDELFDGAPLFLM